MGRLFLKDVNCTNIFDVHRLHPSKGRVEIFFLKLGRRARNFENPWFTGW